MATIEEEISEIKDRCRRIETRLTKFMETQGFDTQVKRPTWHDGQIVIPSMACSALDILREVPASWDKLDEILVMHGGKHVFSIFVE